MTRIERHVVLWLTAVVLLLGAAACKNISVEPSPATLDDSYVPFSRD